MADRFDDDDQGYTDLNEVREQRRGNLGPKVDPLVILEPIGWEADAVPERKWLVPGWIPDRTVTLVTGDGGQGKSLLMLQLMIACALQVKWLGLPVDARRVFGFFCEDEEDELQRRLLAVCQELGCDFCDLTDMQLASRIYSRDNTLMSFAKWAETGEPTALYDDLVAHCHEFGARLLIIDTAADVFGGQEISRNQVRDFVALLRRLALDIDGSVIMTAHPSVKGMESGSGISGSTAWSNSVRSRLYLTSLDEGEDPPEDAPNIPRADWRRVTKMKANYGPRGGRLWAFYQNGLFKAHKPPQDAVDRIDAATLKREAEDAFLACLEACERVNNVVSEKPRSGNYAPKTFRDMPAANGLTVKRLENAMKRLLQAQTIRIDQIGPPSRNTTKIILNKTELLI